MQETKRIDVHNVERNYKCAMARLDAAPISEENRKTIKRFIESCKAEGLSKYRIMKYSGFLVEISGFLNKDFESAGKLDVEKVMGKVQDRGLAAWTIHDYKITIKKFYRWLRQAENPPEIKWIKTNMKHSQRLLPEGLLLEEDILKLIEAAPQPRDRALIAFLWESGARIGEVLNMRIGSLEPAEPGMAARLSGKTGSRRIRIVSSVPYLAAWLNMHPGRNNKDSPLWVGVDSWSSGMPVCYRGISKMLKLTAQRAGISKRVNPHAFRHSRATFLAARWSESVMKNYLGWTGGSDMAAVYVHLSGKNMDDEVLGLYGHAKKEAEESKLQPRTCQYCRAVNPATADRCGTCGQPLSADAAARMLEEKEKNERLLKWLVTRVEKLEAESRG